MSDMHTVPLTKFDAKGFGLGRGEIWESNPMAQAALAVSLACTTLRHATTLQHTVVPPHRHTTTLTLPLQHHHPPSPV